MKLSDYIDQELPFKAWLDEFLDPADVKTIFDIGACEAEDSIRLSQKYPNATVYAFEPLPKNIKLSKKHIKEYGANRVKLFPFALSNSTDETTFFVSSGKPDTAKDDPDWDYGNKSSSLLAPDQTINVHKWLKFNNEMVVKTERLDSFCKQRKVNEIDFLYMDVQGAELMVLEGAGELLGKVKAIWLEVEAVELYKNQPLRKEVETFMKESGYTCVMDTVDDVSGDQLYVKTSIVKEADKLKRANPEAYAKKLEAILSYLKSIWDHSGIVQNQKLLLEKRIETLNLELNKLFVALNKNVSVTVLMSIYNGERFLKPAIEGILNQTYKDFEFIIIDDGSTDASAEIVKSYKDSRIRLISQTNHGFIYSLNKGIELARGKFIARMDQDDIALPTRLEEQMKLFNKNPKLGAVSTFFELINFQDGKPLGKIMVFPINSIDIKRAMYVHNPMAHGSTTFRKKAWQKAGKYRTDYHPPEDYDLWRRIAKDWDLGMVPKVLFQYRINNPESMSQKNIALGEDNINKIQRELIEGPFINKSTRKLIVDYVNINEESYGEYAERAKIEYISLQQRITNIFLDNISPRKAFSSTLFLLLIKPQLSKKLVKKYLSCVLSNLKRRLRSKQV